MLIFQLEICKVVYEEKGAFFFPVIAHFLKLGAVEVPLLQIMTQ